MYRTTLYWNKFTTTTTSWTTLRGKHCRNPIAVMGVEDPFGHWKFLWQTETESPAYAASFQYNKNQLISENIFSDKICPKHLPTLNVVSYCQQQMAKNQRTLQSFYSILNSCRVVDYSFWEEGKRNSRPRLLHVVPMNARSLAETAAFSSSRLLRILVTCNDC